MGTDPGLWRIQSNTDAGCGTRVPISCMTSSSWRGRRTAEAARTAHHAAKPSAGRSALATESLSVPAAGRLPIGRTQRVPLPTCPTSFLENAHATLKGPLKSFFTQHGVALEGNGEVTVFRLP